MTTRVTAVLLDVSDTAFTVTSCKDKAGVDVAVYTVNTAGVLSSQITFPYNVSADTTVYVVGDNTTPALFGVETPSGVTLSGGHGTDVGYWIRRGPRAQVVRPALQFADLLAGGQPFEGESCPPFGLNTDHAVLTTGVMLGTAVFLRKGRLVSTINHLIGATAGGTETHSIAGLYNLARTSLLATSADGLATDIPANTELAKAMTTPYRVLSSNWYYAVLMVAVSAGSLPSLWGPPAQGNVYVGAARGRRPLQCWTSDTALTTALPATPGAATGQVKMPYVRVA